MPEQLKVLHSPPIFPEHTVPLGTLPRDNGAQALWYYYVLAGKNYAKLTDGLELESDPIRLMNFERLWLTVAEIYAVDPNVMGNYWSAVDKEMERLNLLRMTNALRSGVTGYTTYKPLPQFLRSPFGAKAVRQ